MKNIEKIKEISDYCLNCKIKPCQKGCPLGNDIPEFISKIKNEKYEEAFRVLEKTSVLFEVCGKICPHSKQCQGKCVRGIKGEPVQIGELEAFVGEYVNKNKLKLTKLEGKKPYKIAVIGSGPAGLTVTAYLAKRGYQVTIYEKEEQLGGILKYGIPDFRLEKSKVDNTVNRILELGVKSKCNMKLGQDMTIESLRKEYDAVFLGIGANLLRKMQIEGEEKNNVFAGNELLRTSNHPNYEGKSVIIIGGGNVAIDSARTVKRLGAKEVKILYRREEEQMPAEPNEIKKAKQEGIEFVYKTKVQKILGEDKVEQVECIKTMLVHKEGKTRLYPVDIPKSEFFKKVDYVILAIGAGTDKELIKEMGLELNEEDYIKIDENYMTNIEGVFAAGDTVGEIATVAWASRSGREAGKAIEKWLKLKKV